MNKQKTRKAIENLSNTIHQLIIDLYEIYIKLFSKQLFRISFLSFGTITIFCMREFPVHYRLCSNISSLNSLDRNSVPLCHLVLLKINNISRHFQMSPGRKITPSCNHWFTVVFWHAIWNILLKNS